MLAEFPKAFGIWFKQIERFDPASYHRILWNWDKNVLVPLGTVLKPRKEKVDRNKISFADLQPITVHFGGSIDRREVDKSRAYTMDLFFAHPGDIIVAKIDLKNGAVGIAPDWENIVLTNHFAIYEPDLSRLIPEYFLLLIQSSFLKSYLWRNKVGAEGRKEVKIDFFESIEIPLLPIKIQQAIVDRWRNAQNSITQAEEKIAELELGIEKQFFADLGLKVSPHVPNLKVFAAHWKDFERWSVSYNQAVLSSVDISKGKYLIAELGNILSMLQYGTSEKATTEKIGTPVIRMNNIVDGVLDLSNLKYIRLPQRDLGRLLLKDGDILFNRTNSKELVGKCAVFHKKDDYIFASYLIRFRAEESKADPDYVSFVMNNRIGRQQINALSRQIIGQANVNSQELRSLTLPLPPLKAQQEIMLHVEARRAEISRQKELAEKIRKDSAAEVEALILGTKKI